jgi:hypothetical protein
MLPLGTVVFLLVSECAAAQGHPLEAGKVGVSMSLDLASGWLRLGSRGVQPAGAEV